MEMPENGINLTAAPEDVMRGGVGGGLEPTLRQRLEAKFNTDLSEIRILQSQAPTLMRSEAYTSGNDIHFRPGFDASSKDGQSTIAHEVAHVVQQRQGAGPSSDPDQ